MGFTPGLVSITFREKSVLQVVDILKKADLDAVEWGGDVHVPHGNVSIATETRKICTGEGISISSYGSYYRCGAVENPDFSAVIDSAMALGTDTIRVWPGNKGSVQTTNDERKIVVDDMRRICQLAQDAQCRVALEFHQNTLTDDAESARKLLDEVQAGNLETYWQPPNGMETEEALSGLQKVIDRVSNIHIFHWWPSANERHLISDGYKRWLCFLTELAHDGKDRYLLIEFIKDGEVVNFIKDALTVKKLVQDVPAL